ncbi:type II secretion system ATPase GspE [Reinekea thalattae]|uniref:Type II secretion system protein E n=1 Tax=Reinekea thalattae TaxID=2593301 RepID=A0A5C8Z8C7_9GAMM|nr:type II secretion system ATPase GspE [Reinekea thalattae]TXR53508.1 type II secretion system protein GspE [Reinekea thalattae]
MDQQVPFSFAKRQGVIVDSDGPDGARILYRADADLMAIQETQRFIATVLPLALVSDSDFSDALNRAYQVDSEETMQMVEGLGDNMDLSSLADALPETTDLMDQVDDAPIIRLINAILTEAVRENASDIHIETFEKRLSIRFRVDGVLREVVQPKRALAPLLISRIKVMSKLDIAEKRLPQDGRISLRVAGREVDLRVSTIPANHGERIVLRLLDKKAGRLDLAHLGLASADLTKFENLISRPHGIILVTGPTGSGKTTSLYAALQSLNSHIRNIMTVEDPIEYGLPGIGQTQVNSKVDMTFARGLRAILRQDPDVVMIGEIRDSETAEIAVQASLTGHLVLSTLHTNSAVGAVTRLQDMGIEPFLLASSLIGLVSQRLVRTLCPDCKMAHLPDESERTFLDLAEHNQQPIYKAVGCSECKGSGFRGRIGVYELIQIDDTLRQLIQSQAGDIELENYARQHAHSIIDDGKSKILQGLTTIEEVLRVNRSY